jgi:hypothetical protein
VIDDLAGLVVLDADRRFGSSAVAAPLDVPGDDVFGALFPDVTLWTYAVHLGTRQGIDHAKSGCTSTF